MNIDQVQKIAAMVGIQEFLMDGKCIAGHFNFNPSSQLCLLAVCPEVNELHDIAEGIAGIVSRVGGFSANISSLQSHELAIVTDFEPVLEMQERMEFIALMRRFASFITSEGVTTE